jgi:uncharacterized membrane protein
MLRSLYTTVALLFVTGCSTVPIAPIEQAALADNITTVIAHSQGLRELNPLGFPATIVLKLAVIESRQYLSEPHQAVVDRTAVAIWTGAAVHNTVILFSQSLAPVAGVITVIYLWNSQ